MGEVIKAYKGFNKDMTCRDFRYEEGKNTKKKKPKRVAVDSMHASIR